MGFNPVLPGNNDANLNQINQLQQQVRQLGNVQLFKDDTGTRRVLLGRGKDNFYGMKVSKPGFDVFDAEDENLVFTSDLNVLKVLKTGETSITLINDGAPNYNTFTNGNNADVPFDNPTGKIPAAVVFMKPPGTITQGSVVFLSDNWQSIPWYFGATMGIYFQFTSPTNMRIHAYTSSVSGFPWGVLPKFEFSYTIFLESIADS